MKKVYDVVKIIKVPENHNLFRLFGPQIGYRFYPLDQTCCKMNKKKVITYVTKDLNYTIDYT